MSRRRLMDNKSGVDENTVLLCHFDDTIKDESKNNFILTTSGSYSRKNDLFYFFVDGTLITTINYSTPILRADRIYNKITGNGYIDELCISSKAKYTSNFIPPIKPY